MQAAWELDSECIPRVATPLGGGIARLGLACGAVVGGAMAIGLKLGPAESDAARDRIYELVRTIASRFQDRFGHTSCRGLTGIDLTAPMGRLAWEMQGFQEKCSDFVGWTVNELCELIPSADAQS
jgi:C_GCAxxG_C_C family probable redox protein